MQSNCNTSSAYHVQHAVCRLAQWDSLATKFDRVEIASILVLLFFFFFLGGGGGGGGGLNPLPDEQVFFQYIFPSTSLHFTPLIKGLCA